MVAQFVKLNTDFSPSALPILNLAQGEIHLWQVALDSPPATVKRLRQILTVEEQIKARRFHWQKDQARFIITRGILRIILGRYLGTNPSAIDFCYGLYGKPALSKKVLSFNLSHSYNLALYAIALNQEIGIDLEFLQTEVSYREIANQFFSAQEKAKLNRLPTHLQQQAFFRAWTRKEAYLKAIGRGLSLPLNQVEVSLLPTEPAILLNISWDSQEASRWLLQEFIPAPEYVATLAVQGQLTQIQHWELEMV